jgi:hypothetical protein
MFVANDWHAALLPLLLTARFRCVVVAPTLHPFVAAFLCILGNRETHTECFGQHRYHSTI